MQRCTRPFGQPQQLYKKVRRQLPRHKSHDVRIPMYKVSMAMVTCIWIKKIDNGPPGFDKEINIDKSRDRVLYIHCFSQ